LGAVFSLRMPANQALHGGVQVDRRQRGRDDRHLVQRPGRDTRGASDRVGRPLVAWFAEPHRQHAGNPQGRDGEAVGLTFSTGPADRTQRRLDLGDGVGRQMRAHVEDRRRVVGADDGHDQHRLAPSPSGKRGGDGHDGGLVSGVRGAHERPP
jgi:hypothetical protein